MFLNNVYVKNTNIDLPNYCDNNELFYHFRFLLLKDIHIELYKIIKKGKNTTDDIFTLLAKSEERTAKNLLKNLKNIV